MRRMRWAAYLWPGLPQLLTGEGWSALALAVAAAGLLNVTLLGSFVWDELIDGDLRSGLWVVLVVAWTASAVVSVVWDHRRRANRLAATDGDLFAEAVDTYLKGNWYEAERLLGGILRKNARDLEARIMLATLLRHTRRFDEAAGQLDQLVGFEGAGKWELEIRRERELLAEARAGVEPRTSQQTSTEADTETRHAA